jgi:hypothetical protein
MGRIRMRRGAWLAAFFVVVLGACASGGPAGGPRRGSGDVLTAEEMEPWGAQDLYVVVQRLRPRWLQVREAVTTQGHMPMSLVIDGSRQEGSVELLRNMRASDVEEIRYMNSRDATTQYGLAMMSGALIITTRRGEVKR